MKNFLSHFKQTDKVKQAKSSLSRPDTETWRFDGGNQFDWKNKSTLLVLDIIKMSLIPSHEVDGSGCGSLPRS